MAAAPRISPPQKPNSLVMIVRLALMILTGVYLLILIVKFWRRFIRRPRPTVSAPHPAPELLLPGVSMEEGEALVAEAPAAVPAIPDIYLTVPPELLFESDEPFLTADGKTIRYNFNWQNPVLLNRIYTYRLEKLRDFLLFYTEIDLVQEYRARGKSDPAIVARLEQARQAMKAQRVVVQQKLNEAIAKKKDDEPLTFGRISPFPPQNERFKQIYYVDQQIRRAQEKIDDLLDDQENFLKKKAWPSNTPDKQAFYQARADQLNDDIVEARRVLAELKAFRDLFRQEAELPGENVTDQDIMRWELNQKKARWDNLSSDTLAAQTQLLKEIIEWINREPDRFPEWLVYMVIHFSGMRYMSSHSSFASPRALLENLEREDAEDDVKVLVGDSLLQACRAAVQRLANRVLLPNDVQGRQLRDRQVVLLNQSDKRALLDVCTSEALDAIETLPDDNACLEALVRYRQESIAKAQRDSTRQAMPNWVWAEICKYTPLRLQVADPDWEATSPERWKWQNNRWREVLATWEGKDITSWRQKHRESLELVVTRAVCNEIAEHIQDLRGLTPAAGLTSKPVWYQRQAASDPRSYLHQAPLESDFRTGASILWLEWVDNQPNAWQVARPLRGYILAPTDNQSQPDGQKKGEISKKALAKQEEESDGWDYQGGGAKYTRTRQLPGRVELKKQGKSDKEISAILAQRKVTGDSDIQYLRWRHEATVVGVFDMIDGRYVMTFETGNIGLRLRRLSDLAGNPLIFVGYIPARDLSQDPDPKKNMDLKLVNMLRWDRILPGVPLPPRVRPKKAIEPPPTPKAADEKPIIQQTEPGRAALVIRNDVRLFRFTLRDNLGRPKMEPALPPVRPPLGTHLEVSKTQKLSTHDTGNGVINAPNGQFLLVVACPALPAAVGSYIHQEETADASAGKWMTLHPEVTNSLGNVFKGFDMKGKPIIQPLEDIKRRVHLLPGSKFRVSTTHRESDKDAGNGIILGTGRDEFYLIIENPANLAAEGLYVPKDEVVDTTFP